LIRLGLLPILSQAGLLLLPQIWEPLDLCFVQSIHDRILSLCDQDLLHLQRFQCRCYGFGDALETFLWSWNET